MKFRFLFIYPLFMISWLLLSLEIFFIVNLFLEYFYIVLDESYLVAILLFSIFTSGFLCFYFIIKAIEWSSPLKQKITFVIFFLNVILFFNAYWFFFSVRSEFENSYPPTTSSKSYPPTTSSKSYPPTIQNKLEKIGPLERRDPQLLGYPLFPLEGFPNPSSYIGFPADYFLPSEGFPNPSSYIGFPADYFLQAHSIGSIGLQLERAASIAGYPGLRYYNYLASPAVDLIAVTDLERIDNGGIRAKLKPFDLNALHTIKNFSIQEFLTYLFTAPPGRYRFIIILVSDNPPEISQDIPTRELGEQLMFGGSPFIDRQHFERRATTKTSVHFLIYEFAKQLKSEAVFLGPGRLSAYAHMTGSGLVQDFTLPRGSE